MAVGKPHHVKGEAKAQRAPSQVADIPIITSDIFIKNSIQNHNVGSIAIANSSILRPCSDLYIYNISDHILPKCYQYTIGHTNLPKSTKHTHTPVRQGRGYKLREHQINQQILQILYHTFTSRI